MPSIIGQKFPPAAIPLLAVLLTVAALLGCAAPEVFKQPPHPLLGRIHDVHRNAMVHNDALLRDFATADYILLGEVHDNPQHHRLQAEILRALIAQGRRPALAMEQMDREFQPAINAALAQPGASDESIGAAGGFNRKGWHWPFYAPMLATAIEARLPVVAINLSRERTRDIARQGFASLGADAAIKLALDRNWSPAQQAIQMRAIDDGHCGKLPPAAMPKMVDVQRARDATMADALVGHAQPGSVAILGAGHARNDVGVPIYLAMRRPDKRVVTVGFIEVDPGRTEAGDYAPAPGAPLPYDYAWFTSAASREDPCVGFSMSTPTLRN